MPTNQQIDNQLPDYQLCASLVKFRKLAWSCSGPLILEVGLGCIVHGKEGSVLIQPIVPQKTQQGIPAGFFES